MKQYIIIPLFYFLSLIFLLFSLKMGIRLHRRVYYKHTGKPELKRLWRTSNTYYEVRDWEFFNENAIKEYHCNSALFKSSTKSKIIIRQISNQNKAKFPNTIPPFFQIIFENELNYKEMCYLCIKTQFYGI